MLGHALAYHMPRIIPVYMLSHASRALVSASHSYAMALVTGMRWLGGMPCLVCITWLVYEALSYWCMRP